MYSSDGFTNLHIFCETEFVLFIPIVVEKIRRFEVTEFVKLSDEFDICNVKKNRQIVPCNVTEIFVTYGCALQS